MVKWNTSKYFSETGTGHPPFLSIILLRIILAISVTVEWLYMMFETEVLC